MSGIPDPIINFTYDNYIFFLNLLSKRYNIIPFQRYMETSSPKLILRHDVDGSLIPALQMAMIENKLGINATYLVLFSCKFYNLLEESNLSRLREISKMGHEIGLHYDVLQYKNYDQPFRESLIGEISLLKQLIKKPVTTIARHNVCLSDGDPFEGMHNPMNAYNDEFTKDALYVSDSCRAWDPENIYDLMTKNHPVVQLLVHPMLWWGGKCSRDELLDFFFEDIEKENYKHKENWKLLWKEQIESKHLKGS